MPVSKHRVRYDGIDPETLLTGISAPAYLITRQTLELRGCNTAMQGLIAESDLEVALKSELAPLLSQAEDMDCALHYRHQNGDKALRGYCGTLSPLYGQPELYLGVLSIMAPSATSARRGAADMAVLFHNLFDNAKQGIVVHRNYRPLYANASYARIFDFEDGGAGVVAQDNLVALLPEKDQEKAESHYADVISGKISGTALRVQRRTRNGRDVWVDLLEQVVDWDGEPAVMATLIDITDQVRAEQEAQDVSARMQAAFVAMPAGIAMFDEALNLIVYNQLWADLWGYTEEDLAETHNLLDLIGRAYRRSAYPNDERDLSDIQHEVQCRFFAADANLEDQVTLADGRVIEIRGSRRPQGGFVLTYVDITERVALEDQLKRLATTDPLTGLWNRRKVMDLGQRDLRLAYRHRRPLSVLMLDLDHFKSINDSYGHAAGDEVLKKVTRLLADELRTTDILGRLGGEEFCMILPETAAQDALILAERVRQSIAGTEIKIAPNKILNITLSIGLAEADLDQQENLETLLERADQALYGAKDAGRDCVTVAEN